MRRRLRCSSRATHNFSWQIRAAAARFFLLIIANLSVQTRNEFDNDNVQKHLNIVPHLGSISVCLWFVITRCADLFSSSQMPGSLHNCDHQYRSSFALRIFCVSFLNMSMALSLSAENAPPPQRIIAYECMNPKCAQSFSNMHSYDVHRYHARNVGTLCASLTMRREIVATRRAGLTTAVIKRIPSKGKPRQCAWCIHIMLMTAELF